jgi:hypothetical protein
MVKTMPHHPFIQCAIRHHESQILEEVEYIFDVDARVFRGQISKASLNGLF